MDKETEKQALEAFDKESHFTGIVFKNTPEYAFAKRFWMLAWEARGRASGQQVVEDYVLNADKLLNVAVSLAHSYRGSLDDENPHEEFTSRNENLSAGLRTKLAGIEDAIDKMHSLHAQLLAASPQIITPAAQPVSRTYKCGCVLCICDTEEHCAYYAPKTEEPK